MSAAAGAAGFAVAGETASFRRACIELTDGPATDWLPVRSDVALASLRSRRCANPA